MSDPELEQARRLRAAGAAATASGRPAVGAKTLRTALDLATRVEPRDRATEGRILISLAYAEAEQGDVTTGLRLLDEAEGLLDDHSLVHGQRGLLFARMGRIAESIGELDRAVAELRVAGEPGELGRALLNRAYVRLVFGLARDHLGQISIDLITCLRIAREHGISSLAVKAIQSLGFLDFLSGNLPSALRQLDEAARECLRSMPSYLPAITLDKAKVLLAAGLPEDAGRELDQAIEELRQRRMSEDLAEAELARAAAALLAGQPDTAGRLARLARRRFRRRDNASGAELAASITLRADFARGAPPAQLARRGTDISRQLAALGLVDDAMAAALLAARAAIRAGRLADAATMSTTIATPDAASSLDLQLLWHITHAELAAVHGDESTQLDHLRTGLARLHRHRALLGSVDLQTGIAIHGRELADAGLASALVSGPPQEIFEWTELARAQAFRISPVRPPKDPDSAQALGQLRHLRSTLRQAERRGDPIDLLRERRTELERTVRERAWLRDGTRISTPVATLTAVLDQLADHAMVIYLRQEDRLAALVLARGKARLIQLGAFPGEWIRRLHADLDTLASRNVPGRMREVLVGAARQHGTRVADALISPLLPEIGDAPVVLIPTGSLFTLPWPQLPGMCGRPIVVTPSATAWLTTRQRATPANGRALLAAGPGLTHATAEIESIAAVLSDARCLTGPHATPAATLDALDGAPLAHLAAHGHHEPGNALFASIELAGGALMGYDLTELNRPPRHVVLSACELGMSTVRTGDEITGMVAALLYGGSATVIASVCRVDDSSSREFMISYHRRLAAGSSPAEALAAATAQCPLATFVCFGSG